MSEPVKHYDGRPIPKKGVSYAEYLISLAQNPQISVEKGFFSKNAHALVVKGNKYIIGNLDQAFFDYAREQGISLPEKTTPVSVSDKSIKELKAELKATKDALTAAKKELKTLRDELDNTRNDQVSYYLQWKEDKANEIIRKQLEVVELQNKFDNLSLQSKTQTGEITELEREILTARLSGSLENRLNIVVREWKAQKDYFKQQYDEMGERIKKGEVYEFEIQSIQKEAVAYYSGTKGMATYYHNNQPLPLKTDRDKAIAYLLKQELPYQQYQQFGKPYNSLVRKLRNIHNQSLRVDCHSRLMYDSEIKFFANLETAENQLMKGSIEDRAEINLTYDINTPDGEKKVRELFYGSRHDEAQAELFERVFAMAQKLGVEVRHAL
ncbi:MAG: hypothetical protein IJ143_04130, partial [Neisseriaceae bacterium]|nr:hypothetical protein [Neisseriaceae bacterium]